MCFIMAVRFGKSLTLTYTKQWLIILFIYLFIYYPLLDETFV